MNNTKMNMAQRSKVINGLPLGVQYYGPPHSNEKDWQKDFPLIKEHGIEIIVVWAIWGHLETRPDQYDFSEWDCFFDVAHAHGLMVMPNTTIEIQPYWIHRRFPDAFMLDQRGNKIISTTGEYTGGMSPGVCFDHEEPREQAAKFLTSFASHFRNRENLFGWDAWCELRWNDNVNDRAMDTSQRISCYCERTVNKFRSWLGIKYTSLEGLNDRWRHKYTDWEDVFPPRGGWWSYGFPETIDWYEFRMANTFDKLKMRVDAIRKGDPVHPVMNHTSNASMTGYWFCESGSDEWQNARVVDMYGTSFYPMWRGPSSSPEINCMHLDGVRSAARACEKPFWISELQGGPSMHSPKRGKNYSAKDLKFWTYCALAHGAKGLLYWSWRPEPFGPEALGFGITTYGGVPTLRTQMVKEVANTVKKHESLLADAQDCPAQTAILYDPDIYIINHLGGTGGMEPGMVSDSVHGYYKALWENDIPCDFIHATDIHILAKYKMLILPFAFCLRENVAEAIKAFIKGGGTVISEAYFGRYSEGCVPAITCPAYGLYEVFKVQTTEAEFIDSERILPSDGQELFEGVDLLTGYRYKELPVLLDGAEILASFSDGTPAVVRNRTGSGQTIFFGALMGCGYNKPGNNRSLAQLMKNIASSSGVAQSAMMINKEDGLARVRVLKNGKKYLVFCLNYGKDCTAKLELNLGSPSEIRELLIDRPVEYNIADKKVNLEFSMKEKEVKVLLFR